MLDVVAGVRHRSRRCVTPDSGSPATRPRPRWPRRRPGSTDRGTCARHPPMPMRAACVRCGVPVLGPQRGPSSVHRCSPATSSRRTDLRVRRRPSPCGRLSRPPSTAAAPPRSDGNRGRCTCPRPGRPNLAGTAGALPTFTTHRLAGWVPSYTPVASPAGTATRRLASLAPKGSRTNETASIGYGGPSTTTAYSHGVRGG